MPIEITTLEKELKEYDKQKSLFKKMSWKSAPVIIQLKDLIKAERIAGNTTVDWNRVFEIFFDKSNDNDNRTFRTFGFFKDEAAPLKLFNRLVDVCFNKENSSDPFKGSAIMALRVLYANKAKYGSWTDDKIAQLVGTEASELYDKATELLGPPNQQTPGAT